MERRNDLTAFLAERVPARDVDWSPIAGMVRDIVENDVLPRAAPRLGVLPMAPLARRMGRRQFIDGGSLSRLPSCGVLCASDGGLSYRPATDCWDAERESLVVY